MATIGCNRGSRSSLIIVQHQYIHYQHIIWFTWQ